MQVIHVKENYKFSLIQNNLESYIIYQRTDNSVYNFISTFVPESLRGKGIAAHLAKYALEYAKNNQWKIIASCWYIAQYVDRNPEYKKLLAS